MLVVLLNASASMHAQWLHYTDPGTPRARDGKPKLSAPRRRTFTGKPDLSGIWITDDTATEEKLRLYDNNVISQGDIPPKYFINILADFKPGEAPLRASESELRRRFPVPPAICPATYGIPQLDTLFSPYKIIQTSGELVMLYETGTIFRQIFVDGRKLPSDPQPAWLGFSVGKWDHNSLIVETAGFNNRRGLDITGFPHSDALRIMERFHRIDFGHMDVEITMDDPNIFTRAIIIKINQRLLPDTELLEYFCDENERDAPHVLVRSGGNQR